MYRVFIPSVLIICFEVGGFYYFKDFSLCAIILITSLLFFSWIFNFPEGKWLMQSELRTKAYEIGKKEVRAFISSDKKIKDILHDYVDLKDCSNLELRIEDTTELIEDTQEAIVKTLIPYLFILASSIFTYFFVSGAIDQASYPDLVKYKNFVTLTYLGVAFCYIAWNFAPVMVQKKKNKLGSGTHQ